MVAVKAALTIMNDLEEGFIKLLNAPFDQLRDDYHNRKYSKEEAESLQQMLQDRLGVEDPEGPIPDEAWRRSNWCSDY